LMSRETPKKEDVWETVGSGWAVASLPTVVWTASIR